VFALCVQGLAGAPASYHTQQYTQHKRGLRLDNYVLVKKSQVAGYVKTFLYILNDKTGHVLYKPVNKKLDNAQYSEDQYPNLYIRSNDRKKATKELQAELKRQLVQKIRQGELSEVKYALCEIVNETFSCEVDESIESLPDTIDIVYEGYSEAAETLKDFSDISYAGYPLVNHSVNVMVLTLIYCLYNRLDEDETKRISLCGLLHDVGVTKLPKELVASQGRLTDKQYREYQTHPSIGHDIIKQNENIDSSIAVGILEHHERLDGSGYPRGIAEISFEGRLIGLLSSFDHLTNSEKSHRKKRSPFDAMMLIKDEVLKEGRFDKAMYKDLCICLGKNPLQ
jgi:HD-GYP domain-containing protein (c-di-GMP phosphodiesterase class II)